MPLKLFNPTVKEKFSTTEELEVAFGAQAKTLRLRKNVSQQELAEKAGISLSALQNLESGKGVSLKTVINVVRALGRVEWLQQLAPSVSVSPMAQLTTKGRRERASKPRGSGHA